LRKTGTIRDQPVLVKIGTFINKGEKEQLSSNNQENTENSGKRKVRVLLIPFKEPK